MLFAVHIADGVLTLPWIIGGFVFAAVLIGIASFRVRDEEIPRIGLFSAAIFVGSQLHIPLGISSVHLLLNSLAGLSLGRRAPLAIAVGLTLQSLLFAHGGKFAFGVNLCVLAIPAIIVWVAKPMLDRLRTFPRIQSVIVTIAIAIWLCLSVTTIQLIVWKWKGLNVRIWLDEASQLWLLHLEIAIPILLVSLIAGWRLKPALTNGLLLGGSCAMLTVILNLICVAFGGMEGVRSAAAVTLFAHLPIIAIEALGVAAILPIISSASPPARPSDSPSSPSIESTLSPK